MGISYIFYLIGTALIATALISWLIDKTAQTGTPVHAVVKKVVSRDNHDGGYLTFLERDQTFVFPWNGAEMEIEEKRSGILFSEGQEADLLYNPKKKAVYYPGENRFNPLSVILMVMAGVPFIVGGLTFEKNQPLMLWCAAAVCVIYALLRVLHIRSAMQPAHAVECTVKGIFRREDKKGIGYYPVYELDYKGYHRRIVRSYAGSADRSVIGKKETLHIDPWTSDFTEGEKEFNRLIVSLSLTLAAAFILGAVYLTVLPVSL